MATIIGSSGNDSLSGTDGDDLIDLLAGDDSATGLGGADSIVGGEGDDSLAGGDGGGDMLDGGNGNDSLDGDEGDDFLTGGAGDDRQLGGAGDDIFFLGVGNDTVDGGPGDDRADYFASVLGLFAELQPGAQTSTITDLAGHVDDTVTSVHHFTLTPFADTVTGAPFSPGLAQQLIADANFLADTPVVDGDAGDNGYDGRVIVDYTNRSAGLALAPGISAGEFLTPNGFGGSDRLVGVLGIVATAEDDVVNFGGSAVVVRPGFGDDSVRIGPQGIMDFSDAIDRVVFSFADTTVSGGLGNDTLLGVQNFVGGDFGNALTGTPNDNAIFGGVGSDVFVGNGGLDSFVGGGGDDFFVGSPLVGLNRDVVQFRNGAPAQARAFVDPVQPNHAWYLNQTFAGSAQLADLTDIDALRFDGGTEITLASLTPALPAINGVFLTDSPGDVVTGTAFNDSIASTAGRDTVIGGGGADILGAGVDGDLIFGGLGQGADLGDVARGGDGADSVLGGAGGDRIGGAGGADVVLGEDGNDSLAGGNGGDVLLGGIGDDWLAGEDGGDAIAGGLGADTLDGGNGADRVEPDSGDVIAIGGPDNGDILVLGPASAGVFHIHLFDPVNQNASGVGPVLRGFEGVDARDAPAAVDLAGGLLAGGGVVLIGGAFADTLDGGEGADVLYGGGGADTIAGGDGNDTLIADAGNDGLSGGGGADDFFYPGGADAGAMRIADFTPGADDVVLPLGLAATPSAALALAQQVGADAVLSFGSGRSITLVGVQVATLSAVDFEIV